MNGDRNINSQQKASSGKRLAGLLLMSMSGGLGLILLIAGVALIISDVTANDSPARGVGAYASLLFILPISAALIGGGVWGYLLYKAGQK